VRSDNVRTRELVLVSLELLVLLELLLLELLELEF
jgi:hypothetical protein